MAKVIHPTSNEQQRAGVGTYRPVPFLLSEEASYLRSENRYLRQLASGWWAKGAYVSDYSEVKELADNTVSAYAKDLCDFYSYQEVRKFYAVGGGDPVGLLNDYRTDLKDASWRRMERVDPVAASTRDRRCMVGRDYLQWCEATGSIPPVLHRESAERLAGYPRQARRGRPSRGRRKDSAKSVRQAPEDLEIPTWKETEAWAMRVHARHGAGKSAACGAVLAMGLRREEAVLFRTAQLPVRADADWTEIRVLYGTKSRRTVGDQDRKGKSRKALVQKADLEKLIRYRDGPRKLAVATFKAKNPGKPLPQQLFLDDKTGKPLSVDGVYRAWTDCRHPIPMGWSPHIGRHVYAMRLALHHLQVESDVQRLLPNEGRRRTPLGSARLIIEIIIQPALGHADERTTKTYLKFLSRVVSQRGFAVAYADYLGAGMAL